MLMPETWNQKYLPKLQAIHIIPDPYLITDTIKEQSMPLM